MKFYKPRPGPSRKEANKMEFTITDGSRCECDAVTKPGKSTLIMGSKQGDRYVITYISDWSKRKEFKRAIRAIRKGHDCKKQIEEIAGQTDANNGGLSTGSKPGEVDVPIPGDVIDEPDKKEDKDKNRNKSNKKDKKKKKKKKKKDDKSSEEAEPKIGNNIPDH